MHLKMQDTLTEQFGTSLKLYYKTQFVFFFTITALGVTYMVVQCSDVEFSVVHCNALEIIWIEQTVQC